MLIHHTRQKNTHTSTHPGGPLKKRTHADIIMSKLDENKITLDSLSQELNSLKINSEDKAQNEEHHKTESSNIETN